MKSLEKHQSSGDPTSRQNKAEEKNPRIDKSINNILKDTREYCQDREFKDKYYPKKVD